MTEYTTHSLDVFTSSAYRALTFPRFAALLDGGGAGEAVVALGVRRHGRPVGLMLAQVSRPGDWAEILSLYVTPADRSRGVATNLLVRMEQELRRRGCPGARLIYMTGKPTTTGLERLLTKAGWSAPSVRMFVGHADGQILRAAWLDDYPLPGDFELSSWTKLCAEERMTLQQQLVESGQGGLIPSPDSGEPAEPINSFGLRYRGDAVGWIVTHRMAPDTIRYTSLYVRPEHQRLGRAISLLAAAIRRQRDVLGVDSNAIFAVWAENRPMVQFLERRMRPYLRAIAETRQSFKVFS